MNRIGALSLARALLLTAAAWLPASAAADPSANGPVLVNPGATAGRPLLLGRRSAGRLSADWDRAALRRIAPGRLAVTGVPLLDGLSVDLVLAPARLARMTTRFVVGRRGYPDRPLDFDPSQVTLLLGTVRGRPGSHVVLAVDDASISGSIVLATGGTRYHIAARRPDGEEAGPAPLSIVPADAVSARPDTVPLCGTAGTTRDHLDGIAWPASNGGRPEAGETDMVAAGARRGQRQFELAVDTDFEFFSLFGDLHAAAAYLVALYGEVSTIYERDLDTRVELVFARLWDDPDDLFNDVDPSPLRDFRNYWYENMDHVRRDAAQLLSGRRDYPFGGQAWLSSTCGFLAYSVVGYAMGFFPDPSVPSSYRYDIVITAHELGHTAGTAHTHDTPNNVDTCNNVNTPRQRGTIMSYCGETGSGMNANLDLYFHSRLRRNITAHLDDAACIALDCNRNGIPDREDIAGGFSVDADGDEVPDECEDCNANGLLDSREGLPDRNANGIPDECEPDCNGNGRPDDLDIAEERSTDAYGNGVPDECEPDCDGDGVSDYTEIQADMSLDIDRNGRLDACQDCDGDGRSDVLAVTAHGAWIASGLEQAPLRRFSYTSGVLAHITEDLPGTLVRQAEDLIMTPRRNILVSSSGDDRIMQFRAAGSILVDLVRSGGGGLRHPAGLLARPGSTLLVANRGTDSVLAFDIRSGAARGAFVAAGAGGLLAPHGLAGGPGGNLFVTSATNEILEYDGIDGHFVRRFVAANDNGGLDRPRGLVFKPDGNLLVASFGSDEVLEFDGFTGAPLGPWAHVGTATRLNRSSPWGLRVGPNGNVFMTRTGEQFGSEETGEHDHGDAMELHRTDARIYEFDVRNGNFLRTYVGGRDHGLFFPTGFDFVRGYRADCNLNLLPDVCDIASGASPDVDDSGVPDECEADCNHNGRLDRLDIIPYGASYDCNFNLVPDECEADCNHNGLLDACDIARGFSGDCDGDGLPDECDLDGTPPELSMTIDREFLWPPDHRMVEVTGTVVGHDDCGGVEISPPEIASNEPDDAPGHADGATRDDIGRVEFDGQRYSVRLRAERAGGGTGRVYTIGFSAVDPAGNITTVSASVNVPHDRGNAADR